jgi:plasmid stability protein
MAQLNTRLTDEELATVRRRAAEHGMSIQTYVRSALALDRDQVQAAARAAYQTSLVRTANSPEFDELDAELAARPRPTAAALGYDPDTVTQDAA